MEGSQQLVEKIEAYLDKKLSHSDVEDFEIQMANDPELTEEVNWHREVKQQMNDKETLVFQQKLIDVHNELRKEESKTTSKRTSFYLMAAVVTGLIAVALVAYLSTSWNNPDDLYNEYYHPYLAEGTSRSSGFQNDTDESFGYYVTGEYKKAIPHLKSQLQESQDEELYLYLGSAFMSTHRADSALYYLRQISPDSDLYIESIWYTALCHLKMGDTSKTKSHLQQLRELRSIYDVPAKEILEEIEKAND